MQLKVDKKQANFDFKSLEQFLTKENDFISDLFSIVAFPERYEGDDEGEESDSGKPAKVPNLIGEKKTRATCINELQNRLNIIQNKKKLSYKEKIQRKGLKNRLKKKNKQQEKNVLQKQKRMKMEQEKTEPSTEQTDTKEKPVFNAENKMVFSKIDFAGLGGDKKNTKKTKKVNDPKSILENLQKQKEKLKRLEAEGEVEKAVLIKEKTTWKNALAKSQGEKVKDDPILLKKTLARQEQKKRQSSKKWEKRVAGVKTAKEDKQKKRTDNLEKRKKDKKTKKLKREVKKGRVIPGY